jgi:H+/Cl- antiporter ClcA
MKQRLFRQFSSLPTYYRPLIGGISCAAAAAMGSPQSLAVGYSTLNRIISGDLKNPLMLSNFMVSWLGRYSYY